MKTKPILFSTPMVQAILEGRKIQTRRVVKLPVIEHARYEGGAYVEDKNKDRYGVGSDDLPSPFKKGDILWVRETWRLIGWEALDMIIEFKDGTKQWCDTHDPKGYGTWLDDQIYNLSEKGFIIPNEEDERWDVVKELPWKPSIFMPKEAARIFLRVTDVRVERLQDITEDDAEDEGIEFSSAPIADTGDYSYNPRNYMFTEKEAYGWPYFEEGESKRSFRSLWESIHGKGAWKKNPWVWVYDFERIEKPENF